MAFKQQQHVNSWNAPPLAPKSRMTEGEKADFRNKLAKEDEKRRELDANSKKTISRTKANRKRLQKREQELKRQRGELDRKQAEFEKLKAEADLKLKTTLETGQGQPNAYT